MWSFPETAKSQVFLHPHMAHAVPWFGKLMAGLRAVWWGVWCWSCCLIFILLLMMFLVDPTHKLWFVFCGFGGYEFGAWDDVKHFFGPYSLPRRCWGWPVLNVVTRLLLAMFQVECGSWFIFACNCHCPWMSCWEVIAMRHAKRFLGIVHGKRLVPEYEERLTFRMFEPTCLALWWISCRILHCLPTQPALSEVTFNGMDVYKYFFPFHSRCCKITRNTCVMYSAFEVI